MSLESEAQTRTGLQYAVVKVTRAKQNCSLIWCPRTRSAAVIDPGGDLDLIFHRAEMEQVRIEKILITHGHFDHAGGAADLSEELDIPILGPHRNDLYWVKRLDADGDLYDMDWARSYIPERWLEDGERIQIGEETIEAVHCPGHTPGHICYFSRSARMAFVGDVLFHGYIGATELPHGDHLALLRSIMGKLWPLGDDVRFVPGHGPLSTFGEERRTNPFVSDVAMAPYRDRLFADPSLRMPPRTDEPLI